MFDKEDSEILEGNESHVKPFFGGIEWKQLFDYFKIHQVREQAEFFNSHEIGGLCSEQVMCW